MNQFIEPDPFCEGGGVFGCSTRQGMFSIIISLPLFHEICHIEGSVLFTGAGVCV